jgi:hypothetical protein
MNEWKAAALEEFGKLPSRSTREMIGVAPHHLCQAFKHSFRQLH